MTGRKRQKKNCLTVLENVQIFKRSNFFSTLFGKVLEKNPIFVSDTDKTTKASKKLQKQYWKTLKYMVLNTYFTKYLIY